MKMMFSREKLHLIRNSGYISLVWHSSTKNRANRFFFFFLTTSLRQHLFRKVVGKHPGTGKVFSCMTMEKEKQYDDVLVPWRKNAAFCWHCIRAELKKNSVQLLNVSFLCWLMRFFFTGGVGYVDLFENIHGIYFLKLNSHKWLSTARSFLKVV